MNWDPEDDLHELGRVHGEGARALRDLGERAAVRLVHISAWSIEQHLYHLALSADLACANVRALLAGKSERIGLTGEPNALARELFARGSYPRGETQAPRTVWPPAQPQRELLLQEWQRLEQGLAGLVGECAALTHCRGRIAHRQLGELAAPEWLHFARLHSTHHMAIVRDLERELAQLKDS